jgi:hypothetical protein
MKSRLGWNSLERLPKDNEQNSEIIYIQEGFVNLLQKVFVDRINEDKIELNTIVNRISIHEEEEYVDIELITPDQQTITYRADHVVCTQSVGCLKQSMHQLFIPALPHAKRLCIQKLGFGTIDKVRSKKISIDKIEKFSRLDLSCVFSTILGCRF